MPDILKTTNPFTLETLAEYPLSSFNQAQEKVTLSGFAFQEWKKVPVAKRVEAIKDALSYFEDNRKQIAAELSAQMGKPLGQADGEINGVFERSDYLCSIAEKALSPDILTEKENFDRRIAHYPLGSVLIIAAWNYPLVIAVNGVITALLSGNTVILKHSSQVTSLAFHFEKAFGNLAGIDNVLQALVASHGVTGDLIEKTDVAHVIFTGSVRGGHEVYAKVAKRFIDCNLELGGKDGAYVAADADLESAVETLVDGGMYNAGQSCCGIERVYVHESLYDSFLEKAKPLLDAYVLGDPADEKTNMGPLASAGAANEMTEQVDEAVEKGAKVLSGGKVKLIGKATFFEPTLIADVDHSMQVMQEENFGPILAVMKVSDDDEAIKLINDCPYGLTASVFTKSSALAERFQAEVDAGTIFQNRCDTLDPALPWTGYKDSGKGSALSTYGFYALTRRKSIHFKINP